MTDVIDDDYIAGRAIAEQYPGVEEYQVKVLDIKYTQPFKYGDTTYTCKRIVVELDNGLKCEADTFISVWKGAKYTGRLVINKASHLQFKRTKDY